ncbi:NADH:flavin oxidoreductase [Sphingobacterium yanglingense]|uniref:2,4-dienoyl-CoA reductase-like NADH-dependent reductase (Old Yellow Enzyme family) n=1 Tax=Sphingobacterium yanglingense TaxID=1437280 RepID=A0A4R6WG78_9SPHI|nr:NADH:flavin oxidoreductase [Sphingobacterium yanglingense]TDQ77352.1 2,4-dienoyl-CoA reductase-like NADH-dependent reductase (Old Yellow Enzyme family) [Sphingobacterium yanglingense]
MDSFKTHDAYSPAKLGPITLPNRTIKAATSEGRSPDGKVTQALIDFHRGFIEGGTGMTTLAYCAISPEGFAAPGEILMIRDNIPGLRQFTKAMHDAGGLASAQLGHAGPVANKNITGVRPVAPSRFANPTSFQICREISKKEINEIIIQFADAAEVAADSGFDAVELHFGHLYLVSSFLSPWINKRKDEYGGSIENRTRLAKEILLAVKDRVKDRLAIIIKLSMSDGIKGSIWLDESTETARILDETGAVDAFELTMGSSVYKQMYLFRGDTDIDGLAQTQKGIFRLGVKLFGKQMLGVYPYEHLYMLKSARQFQLIIKNAQLILLGGINDAVHIQRAMEEGFGFVALGRALLREPDLINRLKNNNQGQGFCIHCNKCMFSVYQTTNCVFTQDYATSSKEAI